jgi:hypothetical protein
VHVSPSAWPAGSTPQPSASERAVTGVWTELRWSAPIALPDEGSFSDVVSWQGTYVALGQVMVGGTWIGAAFASSDGVRWERTVTFAAQPRLLVGDSRLFAVVGVDQVGSPRSTDVWASLDGRTWQRQPLLAQAGTVATLHAARGTTILALGVDPSGGTAMLRSDDGAPWTSGPLPAERAIVRSLVAAADGFIAVGRDGQPDRGAGVGAPGVGRPAAWWSADGLAWSALPVEGVDAPGAQLTQTFRVADGFFAIGSDTTDSSLSARSPLLWTSTDARAWSLLGLPSHWGRAGANGQQAIVFAYGPTTVPEVWASRDGRRWSAVTFAGDVGDMPALPGNVSAQLDALFVLPEGIVVSGRRNGHMAIWFAEGTARP